MQGAYGGLVIIMLYGLGSTTPPEDVDLLTENNIEILTESSDNILVEG